MAPVPAAEAPAPAAPEPAQAPYLPVPPAGPPPTSTAPRQRPEIPFWIVKPLIGLVLAVVALVVMIRLVTASDTTSAPAVAPSSVSSTVAVPPVQPAGTQAGNITVGGVFLLPLATATDSSGSLGARTGQVVQAQGVLVLSTPSATTAWLGTSADNRVLVRVVGSSSNGVAPAVGKRLSFTGTLVPNGPGLDAGDGAALLTQQGQHVDVFAGAVTAA